MSNNVIDVQATSTPADPPQTQAIAVRQSMAVGQAMGVQEIIAQVKLIQEVMGKVMTDGEHYGTIPGCGDKKTLLQPGAQKLTMTFRLAPSYEIQETDLERGHKEYRVVCTLKSIVTGAFVGQGVGVCSSMESKYRYRGGARKCPQCGKEAIIMGKKFKPTDPEPGWLCWKRKEGCGATWPKGAPEIESQSIEKVENDNPADTFNTVLKMAKKRAFVDATITATAASDIFTQDIGDDEEEEPEKTPTAAKNAPGRAAASTPPVTPPKAEKPPITQAVKPAEAKKTPPPPATPESRQRMIKKLEDHGLVDLATEYFRILDKPTILLPTEGLSDIPLEWVPITTAQMWLLESHIKDFGNGAQAEHPYKPNPRPEAGKPAPPPAAKTGEAKPKPHVETAKAKDPEWWRDVICPVPPRGMKRDEYMKHPQTVGDMYEGRHDPEVNRRLYGFVMNFTVSKTWIAGDGSTRMRPQTQVDADTLFREALDACKEYGDKHAGDTKARQDETEPPGGWQGANPPGKKDPEPYPSRRQPKDAADEEAQAEAEAAAVEAEDDIPF